MREIVETVQSILIYTAYFCALVFGGALTVISVSCGARILIGSAKKLVALSLVGAVLIGGMVVVGTDVAGTKTGTNGVALVEGGTNTLTQIDGAGTETNGTRQISGMMMLPHRTFLPQDDTSVADEDIAAGWRVVSVSSNALAGVVFTMPMGATEWESAMCSGMGWGSWRIPIGGWYFNFGDIGWTNGFAWVEGCFRPRFESRVDEVRLLSERLTLCPVANWSRYNLAASRAWCVTNDMEGLVVTYEGVAVGDDPTKIANVQMELQPHSGKIALRYDLRAVGNTLYDAGVTVNGTNHFVSVGSNTSEVVFQKVHPDDWDMDGLANQLDNDPRVAITNAGWNQSAAWARLSYPSNAVEIALVGGYFSWAAMRAMAPDRRLVGLHISSPSNSWPVCLAFGDKHVMCDGKEEIVFAIDCGARYSFSISAGGELDFVTLYAETDVIEPCSAYSYPYERWANDVVVHLDSPGKGWIGRTADVEIDTDASHLYPNISQNVSAVVTNCHEDAFVSCTWSGGAGVSFADAHAVATTVMWNGNEQWSTNLITCVTEYVGGYALTNCLTISVGTQSEPDTEFFVSCQDVFFQNDLDSVSISNRPERVRPLRIDLKAARGVEGYVTISLNGQAGAVLMRVNEYGITNRIDSGSRIEFEIPEDSLSCEVSETILISCPNVGNGELSITGNIEDSCIMQTNIPFRVIEPLRELVAREWNVTPRRLFNPTRLVFGDNAILSVGVRGPFEAEEVAWRIVDGPGRPVATNGWNFTVEPTADSGVVTVEARFNGDEIQPRFVLPIVQEQVFDIKMFVVSNEDGLWAAEDAELEHFILSANSIYRQVGVRFNLAGIVHLTNSSQYWNIPVIYERERYLLFFSRQVLSRQVQMLLSEYQRMPDYCQSDCIEVYVVNSIGRGSNGFRLPGGVVIAAGSPGQTLAHELGHALGLLDCYPSGRVDNNDINAESLFLPGYGDTINSSFFASRPTDWGEESGCGFYPYSSSVDDVYMRLLMFGDEDILKRNGVDIPDGKVLCVQGNALGATGIGFTPVGGSNINTNKMEVYTK